MEKVVLLDVEDGIATITLNRPDRHNAINRALLNRLCDHLKTVSVRDDILVAIVTGAGKSFCAGVDLKAAMTEKLFDPEEDNHLPDLFAACTKPIIGAVNGHAITGGLELALNCDFLIASDRAAFIDSHVRVGIHPGWGVTQLLQEAIGARRARQMSFTCQPVPAHRAFDWGLVNEVTPHEMLMPRTRQIAAHICEANGDILQNVKSLIDSRKSLTLSGALSLEQKGFRKFLGIDA